MRYILGVDGGSSKTHALVLDETGCALGFGQGGSGNHQSHGLAPAVAEIRRATIKALDHANIQQQPIELGCYCLSGADLEEDYTMLQQAMQGLGMVQAVIIKNDTMAALRAGLSRSWGVVVICGSGFNAAGRSPEGREIVLPGLGPISGDWGGGGALSQEMIRMVMRAWDGRGQQTLLTPMVLDALELPSVEFLLSRLYHDQIEYERILHLVPLLFEAAEARDQVAMDLIIQMGTEVGVTANTLMRRLGLQDRELEVVLGGSVFKGKGSLLIDTVKNVVHQQNRNARIVKPNYEPVVGAALLALEAINVPADDPRMRVLEVTLPAALKINRTG
jgi:N-acetylglucosamine kinase-like BadF-type ATPase